MKSTSDSIADHANVRERCLAYLLGELNERDRQVFESELDDPILSAALIRESELLISIASVTPESIVDGQSPLSEAMSEAMSDSLSEDLPAAQTPLSPRKLSLRSIAAVVSALAATLVFAAFYSFNSPSKRGEPATTVAMASTAENENASFELQLAKTWVRPAIQWNNNDSDTVSEFSDDEPTIDFDESVEEETFEWMVAALEASTEQGDRDDG